MKLHNEVLAKLSAHPRQIPEGVSENYVGGGRSTLRYLGLKVPTQFKIYKSGFNFSRRSLEEQGAAWDEIWWAADCFEVMSLALTFFDEERRQGRSLVWWSLLKHWAHRIDNWAHSDTLSKIYAQALEEGFSQVYPTLKIWNTSPNAWLRRQSVVGLICYATLRKKPPPLAKVFPLVKNLLADADMYVQKGLGWTLRECWNIDPKQTLAFIQSHNLKLSPQAFSYATEKMPAKIKNPLKAARKAARLARTTLRKKSSKRSRKTARRTKTRKKI